MSNDTRGPVIVDGLDRLFAVWCRSRGIVMPSAQASFATKMLDVIAHDEDAFRFVCATSSGTTFALEAVADFLVSAHRAGMRPDTLPMRT